MSIIYCSKCPTHISEMEEFFIKEYDSYKNGHNLTIDGKGITDVNGNFTTRGYKYPKKVREKLSRIRRAGMKDGTANFRLHDPDVREKARLSKIGKSITSYGKIGKDGLIKLRRLYKSKPWLGESFLYHGDGLKYYTSFNTALYHDLGEYFDIHPMTMGYICRDIDKYNYEHPNSRLSLDDVNYIKNKMDKKELRDGFNYIEGARYYKNYLNAFAHKYADEFGYQPKGFKLTIKRSLRDDIPDED